MSEISKSFPLEEHYSLTDQIRRSSRSVGANIRRAGAKPLYRARFVSKLTDPGGENGETDPWIDSACSCGYISSTVHKELLSLSAEVGAMLGLMVNMPDSFLLSPAR